MHVEQAKIGEKQVFMELLQLALNPKPPNPIIINLLCRADVITGKGLHVELPGWRFCRAHTGALRARIV